MADEGQRDVAKVIYVSTNEVAEGGAKECDKCGILFEPQLISAKLCPLCASVAAMMFGEKDALVTAALAWREAQKAWEALTDVRREDRTEGWAVKYRAADGVLSDADDALALACDRYMEAQEK